MSHQILDIEISNHLAPLSLHAVGHDCALLLRKDGRPIDFLLPGEIPSNASENDFTRLIAECAGKFIGTDGDSRRVFGQMSRSSLPSVTAAVCTRNRPDRLARCLTSLAKLRMPEGFLPTHFSILVVDNAPGDEKTKEVVARFPEARYVCEQKPGLDFARNRAWKESTGQLIAYFDDDVVVDPGWLEGLAATYGTFPAAAAFTGLVLPLELETEAQLLFEKREGFQKGFVRNVFGQGVPSDPLYPVRVMEFGVGANMAFVRNVLERIGGFDEALDTGSPLPGGGDLDIFYRIIRSGCSLVYEPRLLVFHEHRRDMPALRSQYHGWGLSFMAFVTKTYKADPVMRKKLVRLVLTWMYCQVIGLFRGVSGRKEYRMDFVLAEIAGGIKGLFGEYARSLHRVSEIRETF